MSPTMTVGGWFALSRAWAAPSAHTMASQAESSLRSSGPGSSPCRTNATFTGSAETPRYIRHWGKGRYKSTGGWLLVDVPRRAWFWVLYVAVAVLAQALVVGLIQVVRVASGKPLQAGALALAVALATLSAAVARHAN